MDLKKIIAGMTALALTALSVGCEGKEPDSENPGSLPSSPETAEETTEEELVPPVPAECSDPNAVTFDDDDFSFASVQLDDPDSAQGGLSVESVQGNKMLKFTDSGTNFADGTVQKVKFDGARLLSSENLAKVRSIEMDVYADATAENFVNEDGENVKAPGWIGGGGGANVSGDKWYDFSDWEGGEYNFDMSGAVHIQLKFLLADGGRCWDETMDEATFMIMRWGAKNEGNLYVDNIVFLDGDGNSLPIEKSERSAEIPEGSVDSEIPEDETENVSEPSE